ncbi:glycoside hydrolase family 97 catalytic domain-containing protein [Paenibacillus aurantius]|uniref:Glycoside hydrolase family 97 catalytic domain-containing protein n=1 Tax=Paenibacillus aurantius TaxID=2918900 RepID=A0AA96RI00_9BACL|nr:glycoside hydrolase family 97 catalytic domain-containing protein [Paenibacillus aurantius]WNQ14096.1 glycoside hydrolase family 97 catalytic domain-containing protein [Paenibacillus aurantius]
MNSGDSSWVLRSPNGGLTASIRLTPEGRLKYKIRRNNTVILEESDMGLTADGVDLGGKLLVEAVHQRTVLETYETRGGHTNAVNHGQEAILMLRHGSSEWKYGLHARAYDDGFAFRYELHVEGSILIQEEASSWSLPPGSLVWLFERNNAWKLKSYAGEWIRVDADELITISSQGPVQGTPLVVELPDQGGYAAIVEAALYGYSGMRLEAVGNRSVKVHFTEAERGFTVKGPFTTPWRVTIVSSDLNGLVNSDLITSLNPPPSEKLFQDTSYIRPGRSVWRWWSLGTGTPEQEREMIEFADRLGFEYTTIDEGWEAWENPWEELQKLTAYAGSKDIGVFVWKRSGEINDPQDDWRAMREFFDKARYAGAAGLKIDFIDNESKAAIDFQIAALEKAAERRLMINFHGISKPTGESRTYPNEISREGIRGLELNKMKEGPIPAWHNAALPFTRFLAGHGDYTPLGFSNRGETTYAHQLATMVVFTSPLQVVAENPAYLLEEESVRAGLDVLKAIPSVWEETRVLEPSVIGELAVFARRRGGIWFLGILNGKPEEVVLERLSLSFLEDKTRYEVTEITDRRERPGLERTVREVVPPSALTTIRLEPNGGYVAMFTSVAEGHIMKDRS